MNIVYNVMFVIFVLLYIIEDNFVTSEASKEKECRPPNSFKHGTVATWGNNLLIEYFCDDGFFSVGETFGACITDEGEWTISPPHCVATGCTPPRRLRGGKIRISHRGAVAVFGCGRGPMIYAGVKIMNSGRVNTTEYKSYDFDEQIKKSDKTCFRYQHIPPPSIDNATYTQRHLYNSRRREWIYITNYTCDEGFQFKNNGSRYLFCNNFKWVAPVIPECVTKEEEERTPCDTNNGRCSQICIPGANNTHACDCLKGYLLASNGRKCIGINLFTMLAFRQSDQITCECSVPTAEIIRGYEVPSGVRNLAILVGKMVTTMSDKEKDLVARLLKQSILTLCKETVSFNHRLEIDGIVCLTVENESHQIVIKVHEFLEQSKTDDWLGVNSSYHSDFDYQLIDQKRKWPGLVKSDLQTENSNAFNIEYKNENTLKVDDLEAEPISLTSSDDTEAEDLDLYCQETNGLESFNNQDNKEVSTEQVSSVCDDTSIPSAPIQKPIVNRLIAKKLIDKSKFRTAKKYPSRTMPMEFQNNVPGKDSEIEVYNNSSPDQYENLNVKKSPVNITCKKCEMGFTDGNSFENHNLTSHNLFTCLVCYNTFTCRNNMKRHMRLHTGQKPYKCTICSESFTRKDDVKRHLMRHTYNKPYRCNICNKGYMDRKTIKNHMKKEHQRKMVHVCPTCGESFDDNLKFQEHKKNHPELRMYRCTKCNFTGSNPLMFHKHMLIHGPQKSYCCQDCNFVFNDPFRYSFHLKKHRLESEFTSYHCCFCNQTLTTYDQFVKHEHTHVQGKRYTCSLCIKHFRYPSNLRDHMLTHEIEKTQCHQGFGSETELTDHISLSHENSNTENRKFSEKGHVQNQALPMELDLKSHLKGDKTTDLSSDLKSEMINENDEHLRYVLTLPIADDTEQLTNESKTNGNAQQISRNSGTGNSKTPNSFHAQQNLLNGGSVPVVKQEPGNNDSQSEFSTPFNAHSGPVFPSSSTSTSFTKPTTTDFTSNGPVFPINGDLSRKLGSPGKLVSPSIESNISTTRYSPAEKIKMKIRTPGFERVVTPDVLFRTKDKFACDVCFKEFFDFESFDQHGISLHRRYICEYCGRLFTSKPNRERHVRYHTGEKPYSCELCDQAFYRGDDLKYHRTTRHSDVKPFACNKCGMAFAWPKELEKHIRNLRH
ncbi:hypothetical protein KUTeg_024083 [Tegillarca granosa]|uniref:Uncharacterized protein n=1 Tax=Tegillarca granosa TaxID=220873 RepID=A0ABQ9E1W9_TEGGR|nr:hypothetical protein KUTeg_024083 [Tegillarca granosa]